jgi:hypothetical protein
MRVEFFKIEHRNPNLPHRKPLAGHDAAKHLLHHFVDDGVQKLRMLETVTCADFGKICESDGHAEFPRLHFFPPQLAGQPRGLAQHESQRRLVIVFVLGERRAA